MNSLPVAIDEDERRRLIECAKEPIRTPGSIQSHGILLGVDPDTGYVHVASENARRWLARPLAELAGPELEAAVRRGSFIDPVRIEQDGVEYDAIVTRAQPLTLVELEPAAGRFEYARTAVVEAFRKLSPLTEAATLRAAAAREIRRITGFDRVMVYHFYPDGHGEVVAEDRAEEMEPYLGLHFPSSDIPPQARELYISKTSRAIASTTDPGSPLLALDEKLARLDLGQAELRSVSPHHLQFMRNMGQASTVSFSMVRDGRLVGMITCAHRTERRLPVLLRRALEVLAGQLTLQLSWLEENARLRRTGHVREQRAAFLAPLFGFDDLLSVLLQGETTVLDLIPADGVAVRLDGAVHTLGMVPAREALDAAFETLAGGTFDTAELPAERPSLASQMPDVAGLLSVPLAEPGDGMLFFRGEVARVVQWLGDQGPQNRADSLSPRRSFSMWKQSVTGTATPWGSVAREAQDLGRELADALMRRADTRLAALAMRDSLTGLHNRRYLEQRLDQQGGSSAALLFIDLDDFKGINDGFGHDVGDAVLNEIAHRLRLQARADDVVVRLGGDEFVVLCPAVDAETAQSVAERLIAAIRLPIVVGERRLLVTGSCGVVVDEDGAERSLLERADAAMYRAKRGGRDRASL